MLNKNANVIEQLNKMVDDAQNIHTLMHEVKPYIIQNILQKYVLAVKEASSIVDKKEAGMELNYMRNLIQDTINAKMELLEQQRIDALLKDEAMDGRIDARHSIHGKIHPISVAIKRIIDIFTGYGFVAHIDQEIEDGEHNFTFLNMPPYHPARQMHDTFYIGNQGEDKLLRTHTSAAAMRFIRNNKPPLYMISYGPTFRKDSDKTHTPMFHQFEMWAIDEDLNMGHLKQYIVRFLQDFFENDDIHIRLRPSFFPFTEPSAEIDIGYHETDHGIDLSHPHNKFLEIMGCGMVHPNVLKNCNIDPIKYRGIAFGTGIERLIMLKNGIHDIRDFFAGNISWLGQYGEEYYNV